MKKNTLPIILIITTVALCILSLFILPDTVIIQFSLKNGNNTTIPKIGAVILPLLLGVGGAILNMVNKEDKTSSRKSIIVSILGPVITIIMILVNCIIK